MKSNNPGEDLEKAIEQGRTFVELARWMEIGPARKWNRVDELYLLCLGSFPNMNLTLTSFAKIFGEQVSTVHTRLQRLKDQGYIEAETSEGDARQKYFRLTDKGNREYRSTCLFLYGNAKQYPIDSEEH